jgi:hypothetical protein
VAGSFGVRRGAVRLVSGASSRTKVVDIDAGDPRILVSLLAAPGAFMPVAGCRSRPADGHERSLDQTYQSRTPHPIPPISARLRSAPLRAGPCADGTVLGCRSCGQAFLITAGARASAESVVPRHSACRGGRRGR